MSEREGEVIPSRLNMEPPVFRGCSISELVMLAGISAVILIPLSLIVFTLLGYTMMGIGVGGIATIGGVFAGTKVLTKLKRGRPIGYYQLQIKLLAHNIGIKKMAVITREGTWSIGRNNGNKQK